MSIKIESGIRIPKPFHENKPTKWSVLKKMKIGDSFSIEYTKTTTNCAHTAARNNGIEVTCRKIDKNTMRIWRVK